MTRVLVTGASGFIGRALVPALSQQGHQVLALRSPRADCPAPPADSPDAAVSWSVADLRSPEALPAGLFEGIEVLVHLAALAHVPRGAVRAAQAALDQLNVAAPLALAERAAAAGARRFVFVSSVLVHGDRSGPTALTETAALAPVELYGASKAQAEAGLREVCARRGLELTIVRPPLVYGPGAKGNLARLLAWAMAGRPVPSAVRHNRRSFVGLTNLCSFLILAAGHPAAADQSYLISDQEDLSTGELYRRAALLAGVRPRFLPLPRGPLALILRFAGKAGLARRLLGDLRVDSAKASEELGWRPVSTIEQELDRAIRGHRGDQS